MAADLFDRIERYLESKLPDPEATAILQALEDAEIERTARALRERYIISDSTHHQPATYRIDPIPPTLQPPNRNE